MDMGQWGDGILRRSVREKVARVQRWIVSGAGGETRAADQSARGKVRNLYRKKVVPRLLWEGCYKDYLGGR
jgi:hypothetical protein